MFTVGTRDIETFDDASIAVVSLETGEVKKLLEGGSYARFVPPGHLVYVRAGALFAVPFDPDRLEVLGPPTTAVEDVLMSPSFGTAEFAVSRTGTLAWAPGRPRGTHRQLAWVDRSGNEELIAKVSRAAECRLSPNGERVAIWMEGAIDNLWIHDLERGAMTRLAMDWDANRPIWTPDGERVAFNWGRELASNIYWRAANGSGEAEKLTNNERAVTLSPTSFSPDGRWLVYTRYLSGATTLADLWLLDVGGDRSARPLLEGKGNERDAVVSPDGRWLAYVSDESGQNEVYVQPFPDPGPRWQISARGGEFPLWSPAGGELFYQRERTMMSVTIEVEPDFKPGVPRELFEFPFPDWGTRTFDVARDGSRFLMIRDEEPAAPPRAINLATNWALELERIAPPEN